MSDEDELRQLFSHAKDEVAGLAWLVNALDCLQSGVDPTPVKQRLRGACARHARHPALDAMTPRDRSRHAAYVLRGDGGDLLHGRRSFEEAGEVYHVTRLAAVLHHHVELLAPLDDDFPLALGFQDATVSPRDHPRIERALHSLVEQRLRNGRPGSAFEVWPQAALRGRLPVVWLTPDDPVPSADESTSLGDAVRDGLGLAMQPSADDTNEGKDLLELCLVVYRITGDGATVTLQRPTVLAGGIGGDDCRYRSWNPDGAAAEYGRTLHLAKVRRGEEPYAGLREAVAPPIAFTPGMLRGARSGGVITSPYRKDPERDDRVYLDALLRRRTSEEVVDELLDLLERAP